MATTVAATSSGTGDAKYGASACSTFATPAIAAAACAAAPAAAPATSRWMSPPIFSPAVTVCSVAGFSDALS